MRKLPWNGNLNWCIALCQILASDQTSVDSCFNEMIFFASDRHHLLFRFLKPPFSLSGSCAAAPYRARKVDFVSGCPVINPCCSEFGFCRSQVRGVVFWFCICQHTKEIKSAFEIVVLQSLQIKRQLVDLRNLCKWHWWNTGGGNRVIDRRGNKPTRDIMLGLA